MSDEFSTSRKIVIILCVFAMTAQSFYLAYQWKAARGESNRLKEDIKSYQKHMCDEDMKNLLLEKERANPVSLSKHIADNVLKEALFKQHKESKQKQ